LVRKNRCGLCPRRRLFPRTRRPRACFLKHLDLVATRSRCLIRGRPPATGLGSRTHLSIPITPENGRALSSSRSSFSRFGKAIARSRFASFLRRKGVCFGERPVNTIGGASIRPANFSQLTLTVTLFVWSCCTRRALRRHQRQF